MATGTRTTDLPLASAILELIINSDNGAGVTTSRIPVANAAAQLGTIIGLNSAVTPIQTRTLSTPPGSPITGQMWIVGASPTGAWAGHTNAIAKWDGTVWSFIAPTAGSTASVIDEDGAIYGWSTARSAWTALTKAPYAKATLAELVALTGVPAGVEGKVFADVIARTVSRSRTANVATIVTNVAHGLGVGVGFNIRGLGGTGYNGHWTTAAGTAGTTLKFANTGADETTTADTGGQVDRNGEYSSDGAGGWTFVSDLIDSAVVAADLATEIATRTGLIYGDPTVPVAQAVVNSSGDVIEYIDTAGVKHIGGMSIRNDLTNAALVFADANGWVAAYIDHSGALYVSKISALTSAGGDYSQDEITERNARALAIAGLTRAQVNNVTAAPIWNYNHFIAYGQSLSVGQAGWPSKTSVGRSDVVMIGQAVRPGSAMTSTTPVPLGDNNFHPAVATVQDVNTGALISPAAQASLASNDVSPGEEISVAALQFARQLFLQHLSLGAADDRRFAVTSCGVGGQSIENLSKGAATNFYNRISAMATAVKNQATTLSSTYGVMAMLWLQGEANYASNSGSPDKATYKTLLRTLADNFYSDICVGIAGQTQKPAVITYQTGGSFTVDSTDMSIGEAQLEMMLENTDFFLAGPNYPYTDKTVTSGHLCANGYRWLAMKFGQVIHEVCVLRRKWRPLYPLQSNYRGATVLIQFHVPAPPLQFQAIYDGFAANTYTDKGFTIVDASGTVPLTSVSIAGDALVKIVCARPLSAPVNVYYARKTTFDGNGNLCDSDQILSPFNYEYTAGSGDDPAANIPALAGKPYPLWNWCLAFKQTATAD